jgi:hypothetical protein
MTAVPVRNPDTPASVSRSPVVCSRNPDPRRRPSSSPRRRSVGARARIRWGRTATRITAAIPNRNVKNPSGDMPGSDRIVTMKMDPQIAVAATSAPAAGSVPADLIGDPATAPGRPPVVRWSTARGGSARCCG